MHKRLLHFDRLFAALGRSNAVLSSFDEEVTVVRNCLNAVSRSHDPLFIQNGSGTEMLQGAAYAPLKRNNVWIGIFRCFATSNYLVPERHSKAEMRSSLKNRPEVVESL